MHPLDITIVVFFFVAMFAVAFWLRRRSARDIDAYFLGDRSMRWWMLGASGMASNVDLAGTMLIASLVYLFGFKGVFIELRGGVVLIMAFYLAFMGKWTRRSGRMTVAEWMTFRFGEQQGNLPRILNALYNVLFFVWAVAYFAVATNKFFESFLIGVVDDAATRQNLAALFSVGLILIVMLYTTLSGFAGVVWTDVLQGGVILFLSIFIAIKAYLLVDPAQFAARVGPDWLRLSVPRTMAVSADYETFHFLRLAVGFYLLKTIIDGMSGAGGYLAQRYFAARDERECGLLSAFWIFLMAFRWPLIMGTAVLGLTMQQQVTDPELVLPLVIRTALPVGISGIMLVSLLGAAMSTYSSFMNAGSSYFVKDIYQRYLRPRAHDRELVYVGYAATVTFVLLGLVLAYQYASINDVWGWLNMGLGAGLILPNFLRWYWHRFNGYGYAAGAILGMASAFGTIAYNRFAAEPLNEYEVFTVICVISLVGMIVASLVTPPVPNATLRAFYETTRPFGCWRPIRVQLPPAEQHAIRRESRRDIAAAALAVPWQLALFLLPMAWVVHAWGLVWVLTPTLLVLTLGLYFVWYRPLRRSPVSASPSPAPVAST